MEKYIDKIAVTSFYCFKKITEPEILLSRTTALCMRKSLKGTVLIAKEGFNGSLSGSYENALFALEFLREVAGEGYEVIYKMNYADSHPFAKLKVKLKKEIVTLGVKDLDVSNLKGEYIEPKDWDKFLEREDVVVVDTRNDYEVALGTFEKAINPQTDTFRNFPEWVQDNKYTLKDKKVLMFCTGGIRCEKSTAYLKSQGIDEVYHLKGGILQYLEETNNKNQKWSGECFVFDDRISVNNELAPSHADRNTTIQR
ncbi:MAG: rhodanese-like domain-containing protein [Rickettsiaceae bacterium]|nr:rhodanese-like domain-containing protein [Rickettsiaceae bacterium]